jgi:hypothetical protein
MSLIRKAGNRILLGTFSYQKVDALREAILGYGFSTTEHTTAQETGGN